VATATLASLLVPFGEPAAPLSFQGDLVLYAYLFGLGRFFTIAAALDTGSSFEGMGGAREATFAALAEPAFFLALLVLVSLRQDLSLSAWSAPEAARCGRLPLPRLHSPVSACSSCSWRRTAGSRSMTRPPISSSR
jgi:formate hydrogenlyase subunit 4